MIARPTSLKNLLFFLLVGCPRALMANGDGLEEETKRDLRSSWDFHGFVNVGYGIADGHKHRGVPEGGTLDLYSVAFQLRFSPTKRDEFFVQLARESVGTSPSNGLRDDIEIDWIFYRREFTDVTSFRVGRAPLPVGIYNEVKDVGTLLPFYRPSGAFYGDGTWTSDSIDGLIFSHSFAADTKWRLDADLYYGEWERIETSGSSLIFDIAEIEDARGFWLWLNTPISGLRFGLGANRFHASGGVFLPEGVTDTEETRYFSIDADLERVTFRFEYSERTFTGGSWNPYYLELDVGITDRLRIMALYDRGDLLFEIPFFATFDGTIEEIYGLGLRYFVHPELVLKVEHQWFEGYGQIEDEPLNIFFDDPVKTNIFIVSASYSF